jgi:hypothetical protein
MKQKFLIIVKYFDSFAKMILLKLKNKTNNKSQIISFNKIVIVFVSLFFLSIFYLIIPIKYENSWIKNTFEKKLLEEFKINFGISSDISYNIFPSPHFTIKDSKIFRDDMEQKIPLSEIKELKIFIENKNFFKKEKISIKKILINNANFSIKKGDFKLLDKISIEKFSNKKIRASNSKIFLKDNFNETFAIINLSKALLFYDNSKLLNLVDLEGDIFNVPFKLDLEEKIFSSEKKIFNFKAKKLGINIFNESARKSKNTIFGTNIFAILNSKFYTDYTVDKNSIIFESKNSKIQNSNIDYSGLLLIEPFDFKLHVNLKDYEPINLFNINSIFDEFIKTQLLFNDNISANISFKINSKKRDTIFNSAIVNLNIMNGLIDFNKTQLNNNKIGYLKVLDSFVLNKKDQLIIKSNIEIEIKDLDNLFSFLQTPKKIRKPFKKFFINFEYDFLKDEMSFKTFKIDRSKNNIEILKIINNFNNNKAINLNNIRGVLNKMISVYEG